MGTSAHVVVLGGPRNLADDAEARIADLERRWSRFRTDSELSRLNGSVRGRPTLLSPETYTLVERAVLAWRLTAGRFDPTVLDAIIRNGYDRTFAALPLDRDCPENTPQPAPGCGAIVLDRRLRSVTLPEGVGIDPGGIGKGLAADMVAGELLREGADGVLVDIGGDIRVAGAGPVDDHWVIDVADPFDSAGILAHLALRDTGIATSSRLRRHWSLNGIARHHLLDPATGRPAETPLVAATVIAGEAWWAEALTKVVLVTGGLDELVDASAVTVNELGERSGTSDLMTLPPPIAVTMVE
jgi:FAD:protein FMN transferase